MGINILCETVFSQAGFEPLIPLSDTTVLVLQACVTTPHTKTTLKKILLGNDSA